MLQIWIMPISEMLEIEGGFKFSKRSEKKEEYIPDAQSVLLEKGGGVVGLQPFVVFTAPGQ